MHHMNVLPCRSRSANQICTECKGAQAGLKAQSSRRGRRSFRLLLRGDPGDAEGPPIRLEQVPRDPEQPVLRGALKPHLLRHIGVLGPQGAVVAPRAGLRALAAPLLGPPGVAALEQLVARGRGHRLRHRVGVACDEARVLGDGLQPRPLPGGGAQGPVVGGGVLEVLPRLGGVDLAGGARGRARSIDAVRSNHPLRDGPVVVERELLVLRAAEQVRVAQPGPAPHKGRVAPQHLGQGLLEQQHVDLIARGTGEGGPVDAVAKDGARDVVVDADVPLRHPVLGVEQPDGVAVRLVELPLVAGEASLQ
mmetsp:Transcript_6991/g.13286  ORF Transcript_6991/g.13286 Transcript_6991/m.13286 type:complete len:307 (+) Transcript_6991:638-1558(+)